MILDWLWEMFPVLKWPLPMAVRVWVVESLFVTVIFAPGLTVTLMGLNMKFLMVMEALAWGADAPAVPAPTSGAARSRAPERLRTPAPKCVRRIPLDGHRGGVEGQRR